MSETEFESSPDAYKVKLDSFEGPLDLLIHLIRKNEVNVYDIPIALVTEQYLSFITLMQELNLDVAGEFLVMASTLIHIKSRMLLPRPDPAQDDQAEEDPREALVRRLLEHQKYKAAAELLHARETLRSAQFMRPDARVAEAAGEEYEPELEVDRCCRPRRFPSKRASNSCSIGCPRPRRAASRICSPMATARAAS